MSEEKLVQYVTERVSDWESGSAEFFKLWNEYSAAYAMKYVDGDPRPMGISKNVSAETPRAVNTLATSVTRMQTSEDPNFELRSDTVPEDQLYPMEKRIQKNLENFQFKRNLTKGNRSLFLFGTQVWEKPYSTIGYGANSVYEGTAFKPVSLLQMAYDTTTYNMDESDHMSPVVDLTEHQLLNLANGNTEIWNMESVEKAIDESRETTDQGLHSKAARDARRNRAGYADVKAKRHELILFNGRVTKEIIETEEFQMMWAKYNRSDNPMLTDITIGVLDRKYVVRFHPTPYGTWHHWYNVGHNVEIELESLGLGVGHQMKDIQKDMNRILRYCSNVAKFSLFNMFLAGRGAGLKSGQMNVIPWSALQVDDINQIKELRPQIEGINAGLKLYEIMRDDGRGVTHATTTLQAALSGATATESSLAQSEALRAISIIAEVGADSYIRPYLKTLIINMLDQNPYDTDLIRDVDVVVKVTTDKDYRPEHAKKLLEFANLLTSIRNQVPLDLNPAPIYDYLARAVGINPRRLREPRPQADKMMDLLTRLNGLGGGAQDEAVGEAMSAGQPGVNVAEPNGAVPTSPLQGGLGVV